MTTYEPIPTNVGKTIKDCLRNQAGYDSAIRGLGIGMNHELSTRSANSGSKFWLIAVILFFFYAIVSLFERSALGRIARP